TPAADVIAVVPTELLLDVQLGDGVVSEERPGERRVVLGFSRRQRSARANGWSETIEALVDERRDGVRGVTETRRGGLLRLFRFVWLLRFPGLLRLLERLHSRGQR